MKDKCVIYLKDQEQTKKFASKVAKISESGDIITFSGNLGVGKTSFIQYFIRSLSDKEVEVTSPTFNLLHIYQVNSLEIWHFDLYRLKKKEEVYEIGIEDAFDKGLSLIEWPEIIIDILPKNRLDLKIEFTEEKEARIISWSGSNKWIKSLSE